MVPSTICPVCDLPHDLLVDENDVVVRLMGLPVLLCPAMEGQEVIRAPMTYQSERLADSAGTE